MLKPLCFFFVFVWVGGAAMSALGQKPTTVDGYVGESWEQAIHKKRRIGVEIELQHPVEELKSPKRKLLNLARFLEKNKFGKLNLMKYHFINNGPFYIYDHLKFSCQRASGKVNTLQFLLERPQVVDPSNGLDMGKRGFVLWAQTNEDDLLKDGELLDSETSAWEMAKDLCLAHFAPGLNGEIEFLKQEIAKKTLSHTDPTKEEEALEVAKGQKARLTELFFHSQKVRLDPRATTADVDLYAVVDSPLTSKWAMPQFPKPLFEMRALHLNLKDMGTRESTLLVSEENTSDTPKEESLPIYEHFQNLAKDKTSFFLVYNQQSFSVDNTPLGSLKVMMDVTNLEVVTEPQPASPDFLESLEALFSILQKGGYRGHNGDTTSTQGFHVNVEVFSEERDRLHDFLPELQGEWLNIRQHIFETFEPSPHRARFMGPIDKDVLKSWKAHLAQKNFLACKHNEKYMDINANHLLIFCDLGDCPLALRWPKSPARSALEFRIFDLDLTKKGIETMLKAVKFSTAFTHFWTQHLPPQHESGCRG